MNRISDETSGTYTALEASSDAAIIARAVEILERRLSRTDGEVVTGGADVERLLKLRFADAVDENFSVLYLTTKHRLISLDVESVGTVDSAAVYPRTIVRNALRHNAAAVVLAHNHPSGDVSPSPADDALTQRLKSALELIGVRVLDHIIVGRGTSYSYAERGRI